MNDGGIEVLKEEIETKFIRPCPPHVPMFGSFKRLQEVDAWYNDGWWEGMVVELVNSEECYVCFRNNEVLKFESSKLRPHQDWIDGKWIMSSKVKYLASFFLPFDLIRLSSILTLFIDTI